MVKPMSMPLTRPIHVKVVHEEAIVSAGAAAILAERDGLVASVSSCAGVEPGEEACDVVIADHSTALDLARSRPRRSEGVAARILVLTHLDREWDVRIAMEAGVHGYLLQGCRPEQLVDAVSAVCLGVKYVSGELAPKLADCLMRDELTRRELEVLQAMSTGASNRAISRALGIADATVKAHVRAILSKIGAGARTEAVAIAASRGLTSSEVRAARASQRRVRPAFGAGAVHP